MKSFEDKCKEIENIIMEYGWIDGDHHKTWVLDQIIRILMEDEYDEWVRKYEEGEDGPYTYNWDKGIAP